MLEIQDESVEIDACIVDLVRGLNASGIETTESCCGHGQMEGVIFLADGRVLRIESI